MPDAETVAAAKQLLKSGEAAAKAQHYEQAIADLAKAENVFRKLDTSGHPLNSVYENGVSTLANTLYLLGFCHQQIGDTSKAVRFFESSLINARFERTIPFRAFRKTIHQRLVECYVLICGTFDEQPAPRILSDDPVLDTAYRFPFSLPSDDIPAARLYELAPRRFSHLRKWYESVRKKDVAVRRADRRTDDLTMRTISIGIWSVIASIWIIYGIVVIRTLTHSR